MTPKQRDIVLIPVPFTDLTATKRRPVLVLSATSHNQRSPDVLVAGITSNLAVPGGVRISPADMERGRLPVVSQVLPDKVYALSKKIIVKALRTSQRRRVSASPATAGPSAG